MTMNKPFWGPGVNLPVGLIRMNVRINSMNYSLETEK
jgi:hypothetical protein